MRECGRRDREVRGSSKMESDLGDWFECEMCWMNGVRYNGVRGENE